MVECPQRIENELESTRENFVLNNQSKMLVLVLMATDKTIRLVVMYPDTWFMDITAGKLF